MGTRVSLPAATPIPGLTGNLVADNYVNGLRPLQGSVDSISNLGGLTQTTLTSTKTAIDSITVSPMQERERLITVHKTSLDKNLGIAVSTRPPRAVTEISNVSKNVSKMSSSTVSAFNSAKEAVSSTNGVIALALTALCVLTASAIQRLVSKMIATILRMQRTILAMIDSIRQQVIDLIQRAIDAAMEIIPECPQVVKEVLKELRSIIGKASTMVAAVNRLMREVAACASIAQTVANMITSPGSVSVGNVLSSVTSLSRGMVNHDIVTFKKEYREGIQSTRLEVVNNRDWYLNNNYIWDSTVGKLVEAKKEAEEAKDRIDGLIEDSKNNGADDSPEYKESLENIKKDLEDLIEDLEDAEENLMDETMNTIDKATEETLGSLDDLEDKLDSEMDEIEGAVEDIFDGLESIADEFESPEVQESLATSCADTEIRKVIQPEK